MGERIIKTSAEYGGQGVGRAQPNSNIGNRLHDRNSITGLDFTKTRAFIPNGVVTTRENGDFTKTIIDTDSGYARSLWMIYPYTPATVSPYYNRLKMLPYPPTAKLPTSLSGLTDGGAVTIKASRSLGFVSYKNDGGLAAGEKSTQSILDAEGKRSAAIMWGTFLFFQGKIVTLRHAGTYGQFNGVALVGDYIVLTKYTTTNTYTFFCIPVSALNANGRLSYPFIGGERSYYSYNKLIADLPVLDIDGFAAGEFDASTYYTLGDPLCGQVDGSNKTKFIASNCVAPEANLADAIVRFSMSGSPPAISQDSATPVNPTTVSGSAIPHDNGTTTTTSESAYTPALSYCGGVAWSVGSIAENGSTIMSGSLVSAGANGESYPAVSYKLPIYTGDWALVDVQIVRAFDSPNAYQRTQASSSSYTANYTTSVCIDYDSATYTGIGNSTDAVVISGNYVDTAVINGETYVLDDVRTEYAWQQTISSSSSGPLPPDAEHDYWYTAEAGQTNYDWQQTYGRQNLVFLVIDPVADIVAYMRCTHGRLATTSGGVGESNALAATAPTSTQPSYGSLLKLELVVKFKGIEHVSTLFELAGAFPGTFHYIYSVNSYGTAETTSPVNKFYYASHTPDSSSETTNGAISSPGFYSYTGPQPFAPLLQKRGRFSPADGKGGYIADGDNLVLYLNMRRSEFGNISTDGLVTCCKRFTADGVANDVNDLLGMDALAPTLSFAKILYV